MGGGVRGTLFIREGQQRTQAVEKRSQQASRAQQTRAVNLQVWHKLTLGKQMSFTPPVLQVPMGGDESKHSPRWAVWGRGCAAAPTPTP